MNKILKVILSLFIIAIVVVGIYFFIPNLKPNNTAFAPQSPSSSVSPRLKGIFKGMGDGFSR